MKGWLCAFFGAAPAIRGWVKDLQGRAPDLQKMRSRFERVAPPERGNCPTYPLYSSVRVHYDLMGYAVITGEQKSKVDAVWDAFWSGGIANPLR